MDLLSCVNHTKPHFEFTFHVNGWSAQALSEMRSQAMTATGEYCRYLVLPKGTAEEILPTDWCALISDIKTPVNIFSRQDKIWTMYDLTVLVNSAYFEKNCVYIMTSENKDDKLSIVKFTITVPLSNS